MPAELYWVFWLSVLTFFGSLIVLPIVIIRMPHDYFVRRSPSQNIWRARHPVLRFAGLVLKNLVGMTFVVSGVIMLFTPGQGLLMILVGLSLLDVPGKRAWERRFVAVPRIHRILNRIRKKAGRPPLEVPRSK